MSNCIYPKQLSTNTHTYKYIYYIRCSSSKVILSKATYNKHPIIHPGDRVNALAFGDQDIDCLMQKRRNSIANALELRLICIKPLIWSMFVSTMVLCAILHFTIAYDDVIKWYIFHVTGHLCGNSPVIGEFPTQRPVTRSFDVFFDLRLNKRLSKQCDLRRHHTHYDVNVRNT